MTGRTLGCQLLVTVEDRHPAIAWIVQAGGIHALRESIRTVHRVSQGPFTVGNLEEARYKEAAGRVAGAVPGLAWLIVAYRAFGLAMDLAHTATCDTPSAYPARGGIRG